MNRRGKSLIGNQLYNGLTVFMLALVLVVVILTAIIFQAPGHPLNPFPPPTMPAALVLPTATATRRTLADLTTPVVEVAAAEPTGTATPTLAPTQTSTSPQPATATSTVPATGYRYKVQGSPAPLTASLFNSERDDCAWMGVAGQVNDLQDRPITGILILLGGNLEGQALDQIMMTGTALNYGPAGYEFQLADHLAATTGSLWIQLVDQAYVPLSAKIYFDTYADADCGRNLTIINFKQVR